MDRDRIFDCLRELSDIDVQRELWLSDGSGGKDVSSFIEAVEQLYTDTGLGDALSAGKSGLSKEVETLLLSLEEALHIVDHTIGPKKIIADAKMIEVRRLAAKAMSMIAMPDDNLRAYSERLAVLAVDSMIDAKIIDKDKCEKAIFVSAIELYVRFSMNDLPPPSTLR